MTDRELLELAARAVEIGNRGEVYHFIKHESCGKSERLFKERFFEIIPDSNKQEN